VSGRERERADEMQMQMLCVVCIHEVVAKGGGG